MPSSQRKLGSLSEGAVRAASDPSFCWANEGDDGEGGVHLHSDQQAARRLYIGVTADIAVRMVQHRSGKGSAFARRYGLDRLVLIEHHSTIEGAIAREKAIKAWKRDWKIELVEKSNLDWRDLFEDILA